MPLVRAEAPPVALPRPPIRLRLVLAVVLVASAGMWLFPRAEAAWKLHGLAVTFANYAQCMVGPTGPSLLRGNSEEFQRLVRRRLVSSPASDRPFAKCARDARAITASPESERAHQAQASEFQEYGLPSAHGMALGLSQIRTTTLPLGELAERAWPFAREGYMRLVKPSLGATEAPHPVALPKPAVGRGLPSWRTHYRAVRRIRDEWWVAMGQGAHLSVHRSSDGIAFRTAPARSTTADAFAERCPAGDSGKSFRLGLSSDGNVLSVSSLEPDRPTVASDLAPASLSVAAAACDERALVAVVGSERAPGPPLLKLCPFAGRCGQIAMPRLSGVEIPARLPIDLARVRGTTIVAITTGEVVRVASSRDDGRTWTPFSVAFDQTEYPELRVDVRLPSRLLTLGERVLLYGGGAKSQHTYPVLISDDSGASFRAP